MAKAVAILPADDLRVARAFFVDVLGFRVEWQAAADEQTGLFGVERDGMAITIDAPMSGHGRQAVVSLHVEDADAYYQEWQAKTSSITVPRDEHWGARTFSVTDPSGNTIFVIGRSSGQAAGKQRTLPTPLQDQFGGIDVYVFDQLLRGRITRGMRVFDAGCGGGRNLVYLLRNGFDVSATDENPQAVAEVRRLVDALAPQLPAAQFRIETVEACSFPSSSFDAVISSAVLHFARDDAQFDAMTAAMWRVLKPGGLFFARLASSIGLKGARALGSNRFLLPDGSERYLVSAERLLAKTRELGGALLDPLKTTVVQDQRSMTTWVVGKPSS